MKRPDAAKTVEFGLFQGLSTPTDYLPTDGSRRLFKPTIAQSLGT
jgi:hypothetical protein